MSRSDQQPMRPRYPAEQTQAASPRPQEEWAAYPDMVYQARAAEEEEQTPRETFWTPAPATEPWAAGGTPRKVSHTALWAFIALVCFALLCLMGYFVSSLYQTYGPFRQKKAIVGQATFAQGVLVDGVHIGGMTRAEAEAALKKEAAQQGNRLRLTVQADGQTWIMTENELPFERNLSAVLDTAYAVGRQGSRDTIGSSTTPFEYRYQHLYHTAATPVHLRTQVTYEGSQVRHLVDIIANNIDRDPIDAQVATFDFSTRSFTFTEDQPGRKLDTEDLYRQIIAALDQQNYTAVITVNSARLLPQVTRAELMNSFSLVSTYSTQTTSDANRNNNINLACQAVNGTAVMPGERFSFNQATGQRTTEKGYLPAAAIAGGTTVDEVGGGVCQVSSTLFNAAAMADLTILARSPHTWPSNYVEKGRDATVNWPNLDFSFRNDKATPVFIVAWYQQRTCTVEIYGAGLGAGTSIDLTTRLISTTQPPAEPLYEQNPALEPGTVQEKKKARTGYVVETYKVYKHNGAETRRELLCTSNYQMIQQVIEYN